MSNEWLITIAILGVIGGALSPLISVFGIVLSERRQKKRDDALALKETRDAENKESEIQVLVNKTSSDAIASFGGVIKSLREQVEALVQNVNENATEINNLTRKLNIVMAEKEELLAENIKLKEQIDRQDAKINRQELEIVELRNKVHMLENKGETNV